MPLIAVLVQGPGPIVAIAACVPFFFAVYANLITVHWSDIEADRAVGKRNLVVHLGEWNVAVFEVLVIATFVSAGWLIWIGALPEIVGISLLGAVPVAAWAIHSFRKTGAPSTGSFFMVAVFATVAIGMILA